MHTASETPALAAYEARLQSHRDSFARGPALSLLGGTARAPDLLHLFLIHFAAYGIEMTRPVEGWIRRAGERCCETGFADLGEALVSHAAHEAGHENLMIADLWSLAERWNERAARRIDPIALAAANVPDSVRQYHALHDDVAAGDAPFAQVAIEYEIEALSVRHGPALAASADGLLAGPGGESGNGDGRSFLREHIALDTAHTDFNRRQIARLLAGRPDCLEPLAEAGARALDIYGRFVADCLRAALAFEADATDDALSCRLFEARGAAARDKPPEWLAWLRAMRSHVLFDNGARPAFGPGGGSFGDADPADFDCDHLVLFDGELPVGAVRLSSRSRAGAPSLIDSVFGAGTAALGLTRRGLGRERCVEASRLVLHPEYRHGRTVRRLLAGLWALAADSGAQTILAAVGTASGQDRLFAFFGAEVLDEAGSAPLPEFNDEVRLAMFRVDTSAPPDYPELGHMIAFVRRARQSGCSAPAQDFRPAAVAA